MIGHPACLCLAPRHPGLVKRQVLPNVIAPLIVQASLGVACAILAAASLSFLGLGVQPPTPSWGALLADGKDVLQQAGWMAPVPSAAIFVTVLAFNVIGDGIRDALDPPLNQWGWSGPHPGSAPDGWPAGRYPGTSVAPWHPTVKPGGVLGHRVRAAVRPCLAGE